MTVLILLFSLYNPYLIEIPELSEEPKILNIENNSIINEGFLIDDFLEVSPLDSAKPDVQTLVYMGKYHQNLYVLFICKEKAGIRYQVLKRDEFRIDNDWVMINIDPDNSGSRDYTFAINPAGSLYDDLTVSGNTFPSYDFKWDGLAFVSDTQWSALFIIPFSIFSKVDPAHFRFLLIRLRVHQNLYTYQWPPIPLNTTTDPYGTGVFKRYNSNIAIGFVPYLTALNTNYLILKKTQIRTGLTGRFNYKGILRILLGINPDFSTIETDRPQITLNTPYVLFFPEKRPIFIEGGDVFERENIIYTRRINNPLFILKTFGKIKKTEFGFISAYDVSNSYLITTPYESYEEIGNDSSFINVFTLRKYFNKGNYTGLILNTRNTTTGNSNISVFWEGRADVKEHFIFNFIYGKSSYSNRRFKENGIFYKLKMSAVFHSFSPYFFYFVVSPTYNNQNGFIQRNDLSKIISGIRWRIPLNKFLFNVFQTEFSYASISNFIKSFKNDSVSISADFSFKWRTQILTSFSIFSKNFYGFNLKNLRMFTLFLITSPLDFYSLNFFISKGKGINYLTFPPEKGDIYFLGVKNEFTFMKNISLSLEFKRYTLEKLLSQNLYFIRFFYALSNLLSTRVIYSFDGKKHGLYILLNYQLTAYDFLFLGLNLHGPIDGEIIDWNKSIFLKFQKEFNIL